MGHGRRPRFSNWLTSRNISVEIETGRKPYKGGAGLSAALINGEVSVGLLGTTTAISFIRDGRLKGLSVFAKERIPAIPDVPTLREAGSTYQPLPAWFGWWAPVDTPREVGEKV